METNSTPDAAQRPLHVFYEPDAEEYAIAHDADDATALYLATGAEPLDDGMNWRQFADDRVLHSGGGSGEGFDGKDGESLDGKTCAVWCRDLGRRYLGSGNC